MPKNIIEQRDETSSVLDIVASNTVFIPIQTTIAVEPVLCFTEAQLSAAFESYLITDTNANIEYSLGLGYALAKHLIASGLTVLAQGVTSAGDTQLGAPTLAITDTTMLTMTPAVDPAVAPDTYHISFVGWDSVAGIVYPGSTITIHSATYDLAELINKKGTFIVSVTAATNGYVTSEVETAQLTLAENVAQGDIDNAIDYNLNAAKLPMATITPVIDWTALKDKNLYDIRFLTTGALKVGVSQDMITCAKDRGDCTALVNFDESGSFNYSVAAIQGLIASVDNGEFAAAFTPAFYTTNADFTDDDEVLIPAAFGYLFAYARAIKNNPEWFAVAGFDRGIIPELSRVKHKFSSAEVNLLQRRKDGDDDNVGKAINAIAYIRPAGFVIYGNRTLKENTAAKGLTATSFLNVRNMISVVSKVAFEAANRFTFDQNSETLWINYKSYVEPTLARITHSDGAYGYSINKIKTNKKATLKAEIIIQPIEAVEDIELTIVMTDSATVVAEQ